LLFAFEESILLSLASKGSFGERGKIFIKETRLFYLWFSHVPYYSVIKHPKLCRVKKLFCRGWRALAWAKYKKYFVVVVCQSVVEPVLSKK